MQLSRVLPFKAGLRPETHRLVAQRISNPGPSKTWLAAAGDVHRTFELDDDLLNVDPSSPVAFDYYGNPAVRARVLENIRSADAVTVTTDYLAGVVRDQYGVTAPIHTLPNCLDPAVLKLPPVDQSGPMTAGWAGSPTHRGDFEAVRGPLRRFFRQHPGASMTFAGVDYSPLIGVEAAFKSWRSIWHGPASYMAGLDWQVGLAPLAPTQFNRGKSPIKALEYAARGIVVVASDVGPYRGFVRHGETGFLVGRSHEWGEYLRLLAGDEALRARMGAAARAQASEWTIDKWADHWEKAYE